MPEDVETQVEESQSPAQWLCEEQGEKNNVTEVETETEYPQSVEESTSSEGI